MDVREGLKTAKRVVVKVGTSTITRPAGGSNLVRMEEIAREIARLERRIAQIDDLLFGEAATDYVRAAELTDEKTVTEDRLMQLYEEDEALSSAADEQKPSADTDG